ncbi:MAG: P83/100 family protein [Leptospiraceae bacterium]|nr:P83/100 family protein [Leptospiraceae bacterium]
MSIYSFRSRINFFLFLFFTIFILAEEAPKPNEKEVKKSPPARFINKSNERADVDFKNENFTTGRKLTAKIEKKVPIETEEGVDIKRYYDPTSKLFSGDVITLEKNFKVGHINSVIRVISSYIESAYDYNKQDALTLSYFVLYYNSLHRGDKKFFSDNYIKEISKTLVTSKVGIGKSYKDWPGNTQIIIPLEKNILKEKKKDITIDELEKSSEQVTDKTDKDKKTDLDKLISNKTKEERIILDEKKSSLKEKEKKLLEDEKVVIAKEELIKEKDPNKKSDEIDELVKKKQEIEKEKLAIAEEKKEIIEKDKKLSEKENKLEEKNKPKSELADKNSKDSKKDSEKDKSKTDKKEETSKSETSKNPKDSSSLKSEDPKSKTDVVDSKDPNKKDDKKDPTKTDSKSEAEKQKELAQKLKELEELKKEKKDKEEKSENVLGEKILFLQVVKYENDGHYTNDLWMLDPDKEEGLFKSPFVNICGRDFKVLPTGILVIGFEGTNLDTTTHNLVLLDENNLVYKKSGKELIYFRSHLIIHEGKIYAFENYKEKVHLSRFNNNLDLESRSSEPVFMNSDVTFNKNKIFLTSKLQGANSTSITVLNKTDLKVNKTFKPTEKKRGSK